MTRSTFARALWVTLVAGCHAQPEVEPACPELALLTWNLEWFQHPARGPADEVLQFESVLGVLGEAGAGLIALQEVAEPASVPALLDGLREYAGVVTDYAWPQQLALLFRSRDFRLIASGAMRGLDDAGRPPLVVELQHVSGMRVVVVVVHAKAGPAPADHAYRVRFARGLSPALLERGDADVRIVMGDFNDRLTGSVVPGYASPYETLLEHGEVVAPTARLEYGSEPSTIWGATVDHILVDARCLASAPAPGAEVLRDELLAGMPEFADEVSDHFPVQVRIVDLSIRDERTTR